MKNLLLILLIPLTGFGQTEKKRILFIGNSFTYYWNMPRMVEKMAEYYDFNWDVDQSTLGGANLEEHWKGERNLTTRQKLSKTAYDHIILQDYSTNPVLNPENTRTYVKKFINLPLKNFSKWYSFSTWMYPYLNKKINDTLPIHKFYKKLQLEIRHEVLEVGRVFKLFGQRHHEIKLLADDNKHPSPEGSYLAACVIFTQLSNISPIGLPYQFFDQDESEKQVIYYNIIQGETGEKIQKFVADYFKKPASVTNF